MEEQDYSYPWLRNLFLVVLYAGALIFLWHFPVEGVRQFVQELFRGFGYLLAGLLLMGITLFLLLFIAPSSPSEEEEVEEDEDLFEDGGWMPEDFEALLGTLNGVGLFEGYTVGVPALSDPEQADRIWEILYQVQEQFGERGTIVVDQGMGMIALSSSDGGRDLFRAVKSELRKAHIQTRKPGS
ncbi:MAG: hypothetical protein K8R89_02590 [Anaerolineae bacterium]|nr:hypothetical protein [Anaerolineae bacterium]